MRSTVMVRLPKRVLEDTMDIRLASSLEHIARARPSCEPAARIERPQCDSQWLYKLPIGVGPGGAF